MDIEYGSFSIKGKLHKFNEDRSIMLGGKAQLVRKAEKGQIFAVFDGMGSAPKGGEAAQFMCDSLIHLIKNSSIEAESKPFIESLMKANLEINSWGCIEGTEKEIGACAGTILWLNDENLIVFHAGDTLGLLIRSETEYEILTSDHSIDDALTRFWGMGKKLHVEVRGLKIEEGDILVLVSDGVLKAVNPEIITQNILKWILTSPEFTAKSLCELAERRGSIDDITSVVVEVIELD